MKHYDVIVIGAGPGGIFATYELAKKIQTCPSVYLKRGTGYLTGSVLLTVTKFPPALSVKAVPS